jgi:hypothetical protein
MEMKEGDRKYHAAEPGADSSLTHRCVDKHSIHDNDSDSTITTAAARIPVQSFDSVTFSDDGLLRVFIFPLFRNLCILLFLLTNQSAIFFSK